MTQKSGMSLATASGGALPVHQRTNLVTGKHRLTLEGVSDADDRGGIPLDQELRLDAEHFDVMDAGEELGVISRTLGHSQIATTADIYAHLTPAMLERTATRMDGILTRHKRSASA